MEAKKKQQALPDIYDGVDLQTADDETIEEVKEALKSAFQRQNKRRKAKEGYNFDTAHLMATAGTGYIAACAEQRERAMLRARQKHFKKT